MHIDQLIAAPIGSRALQAHGNIARAHAAMAGCPLRRWRSWRR